MPLADGATTGRALVIHPAPKSAPVRGMAETLARSIEARLEEAVGLAQAIRLYVVRAEIARITSPRPSSLLGSGAVDNFCVLLRRDAHSQLVYKHAISTVMPAQPIQLFEPGRESEES